MVEAGNSLTVDLSKGNLEHEASKYCKSLVVRSRLSSVSNETMKHNTFAHKEEFQRFLCWYIKSVKSPDWHMLQLNHDICDAYVRIFRIVLPTCLTSQYRGFAAI